MTDLEHREASAEVAPHREGFTREQVELVKRTVAQGVNDDELALFLETAKRRGLDPFSGQIHAVMRWDSRAGRDVMKIQTGIDGYRKIADETGLVEYVRGPEFTADGEGWTDTWLHDSPPAAARFYVKRADRTREEHRVVRWVEFVQTKKNGEVTRSWSDMPTVMLGKVAEAHALRAAFPEQLGGIYTADEMDQASSGAPAPRPEADVDQVEERRELFDRFRAAWPSLSDQDRTDVWDQHGSRLWGDGDDDLRERFRSTPVHVLADLVDATEAATPDEDDEPGEGGVPEDDDPSGPQDGDDHHQGDEEPPAPAPSSTPEGSAAQGGSQRDTEGADPEQSDDHAESESEGPDLAARIVGLLEGTVDQVKAAVRSGDYDAATVLQGERILADQQDRDPRVTLTRWLEAAVWGEDEEDEPEPTPEPESDDQPAPMDDPQPPASHETELPSDAERDRLERELLRRRYNVAHYVIRHYDEPMSVRIQGRANSVGLGSEDGHLTASMDRLKVLVADVERVAVEKGQPECTADDCSRPRVPGQDEGLCAVCERVPF